ncbi:MAG TPA: outer membrane beta-barrel protein [Caulobacterales bacterium]|nr:outer membrane beta-barrel protein [Caulobacterales bacterium]
MRKFILAAAAAALLCGAPAVASAQTGYVGLSYTHDSIDPGSFDVDVGAIDGVAAFDLGGPGLQVGAGYANISPDGGDDADDWHVDAHLFARNDQWQWGGAVAYENVDFGGGDNTDVWTGAAEMLFFQPDVTWGATLSYSDASDIDASAWNLNGEARYFFNDNFRVDGNVGLGTADLGGADDSDNTWQAGIGAEYQFASMPISIYGGYEHYNIDTSGDNVDNDALTIGARWNFGGTLRDRDRSGANLHSGSWIQSVLGAL